jgi:hypothetical protein
MSADSLYDYAVIDGIHRIRLLQATGPAAKAMIEHIEKFVVDHPIDGKNRVMIDFRPAGPPPITESLPHLMAFLARQPKQIGLSVRIAYIFPQASYGRVLTAFLSMLRFMPQGMAVKFFGEAELDKALEWLQV